MAYDRALIVADPRRCEPTADLWGHRSRSFDLFSQDRFEPIKISLGLQIRPKLLRGPWSSVRDLPFYSAPFHINCSQTVASAGPVAGLSGPDLSSRITQQILRFQCKGENDQQPVCQWCECLALHREHLEILDSPESICPPEVMFIYAEAAFPYAVVTHMPQFQNTATEPHRQARLHP